MQSSNMSKLALVLGVLVAALQLGSDGVQAKIAPVEEERLRVEIQYNYPQPSDFNLDPPYFRVASSITLLCVVSGSAGEVSYYWTSDCSGDCFVKGKTTESVSTLLLQPSDSGTHTCTARDFVGVDCIRNASASIDMRIVGAGIFDENTATSLTNNGIIAVSAYGSVHISCWFSTGNDSTGNNSTTQFIGPDGTSTSAFISTTSVSNHSIEVDIVNAVDLYSWPPELIQGVYACRTYGEAGLIELNIGIFLTEFSGTPVARVVSLEQDTSNDTFTLVCVTTNSPPTTLQWTKDGVPLNLTRTTHTLTQTILDRRRATYRNVLVIEDSVDRLPGEYSCAVSNVFGTSNKETVTGNVIEIHGHEHILIVGRMADLNCSTHFKSHTKLQWLLGGFEVPLETSTTQSVVLSLDLESSGLNGAMFTCRITTDDGVYDETITLKVKEFENIVTITEQPMPVMAGEFLELTCVVRSDDPSIVRWLDPDGASIINDGFMFVDGPYINGNKTTHRLYFNPLHTSHAGVYVCHSNVTQSASVETASHNVTVQIPAPTVSISQTPPGTPVYTTSVLTLNCTIEVHEAVDIGIEVDGTFSGPEGVLLTNDRITLSEVTSSKQIYHKIAVFRSLQSSDTGMYHCTAALRPSIQSGHIIASDQRVVDANITVALNTSIVISYTPPSDIYFGPPDYRPGTPLTLTCNVLGATGSVSYRWSSTSPCTENGCFASSSTSSSVSTSRLYWYDAGQHTCTVSDGDGNYGSSTIEMNIIGAGMYVRSGTPYGAIPNNSVVIASYRSSYYINIFCVTNSSAYMYSGSLTHPYSRYNNIYYDSGYSPGVARIYSYDRYPSYPGIYTAHVIDGNGTPLELNVGIYNYRFRTPPRVTALYQSSSTENFILECLSSDSAATFVTWVKDGVNLTMDGRTYKQVQKVTERSNSRYQNSLIIDGDPDNLAGVYTCVVSNWLGTSNQTITFYGLQVHGQENFTVGQTLNISCSNDLNITSIAWLNNDMIVAESNISRADLLFQPLSTSVHGERYTCRTTSPFGTQEKVITISAQIPDSWGALTVDTHGTPTEGQEFNLSCTVAFIGGLPQDSISITWLDANGYGIYGNEITEIRSISDSMTATSVLIFKHLNSSHGGIYTCEASVNVLGLNSPPPLSLKYELIVTSISLFQLKFGPVQYCIHWTEERWWHFEYYVRNALTTAIKDRCNCTFSIDNGEFSCQTTMTEVVYRSKIRGATNTFTASELLAFVEDWITNEGTILVGVFRLRLNTECPLHIQSFHQPECAGNTTMPIGCFDNFLASVCAKQPY